MKFAIVVFPGSNCDHDAYHATTAVIGQQAELIWHKETDLKGADAVILPGGFAHGDYLRTGAIARFSPVMKSVEAFAAAGGPVVGFCNGFQILLEAGLLEGAMLRNRSLQYRCEHVHVRVERADTPWTTLCQPGLVMRIPIAHGEGNYFAAPEVIDRLEKNGQVIFRYVICNERRNVVALMPHPERACEPVLGSGDGKVVLDSVVASLRAGVPVAAR
jgi:phosphoribosylformylglycinamidine synthase subunit PurQ / glutaminase